MKPRKSYAVMVAGRVLRTYDNERSADWRALDLRRWYGVMAYVEAA